MKSRNPREDTVTIEELAEGVRAEVHPAFLNANFARFRQDHVTYSIELEKVSSPKEAGRLICKHSSKIGHIRDISFDGDASEEFKEGFLNGAWKYQGEAHALWAYRGHIVKMIFNTSLIAGAGVFGYKVASWPGAIGAALLGSAIAGETGWRVRNFLREKAGLDKHNSRAWESYNSIREFLEEKEEWK